MVLNLKNASRDELIKYVQALQEQNASLEQQNAWFRRQLFGRKSERLIPQDPQQATLFDVPETPPPAGSTVKSYERSARRNATDTESESGLRFDPSVPVDEEIIFPKEVEGVQPEAYEVIGEKVTERLIQLPVQFRVKRTIRKTVKLKAQQTLHTAPAPSAVIERSFADASFLAGLLTDKFQYHLPLYRQHQRLTAAGVHVSRGHLTKLVHRTLELLEPIYYAILSSVTTSDTVFMDETPVRASRREKDKMKIGYFWPVYAEEEVAFVYASTRGHQVVAEVLGQGCKKLLSDGYAAYERYAESREGLVHAQCWAHVRRQFFEVQEHSPAESAKILGLINRLFEIEAQIKDRSDEEILSERRLRSLTLVDELFSYLDRLWFEETVERSSLLGKAVAYARSREEKLRYFLFHADLPLSNNQVERLIRPAALGRKNWLFCWSEVGAKHAATAYTLVECCKLHGVDPWKYLADVLQRIDSHPARDVYDLAPKNWKRLVDAEVKDAA